MKGGWIKEGDLQMRRSDSSGVCWHGSAGDGCKKIPRTGRGINHSASGLAYSAKDQRPTPADELAGLLGRDLFQHMDQQLPEALDSRDMYLLVR